MLALIWAVLATVAAAIVVVDRHKTTEAALERLQGAALILREHADRSLQDAEQVLRVIRHLAVEWDRSDQPSGEAIFRHIREHLSGSPQILSAWVMDGNGATILDTHTYPPAAFDGRERAYFQAHQRGDPEPVIGTVDVGSATGKPRFTLSRSVRDDQGRVVLVVVAAIYTEYFSRLYARVATPPGTSAALVSTQQPAPNVLAKVYPDGPPPALLAEIIRVAGQRSSGAERVETGDGAWIATWQRSTQYPGLLLQVSQPMAHVLADWSRRTWWLAAGASLLAGLFYLAFAMAARADASELALAHQRLLMREVYHRVKNHLAIVAAVVRSGGRETTRSRELVAKVSAQMAALGKIYDRMQVAAAGGTIGVDALLADLVGSLADATGRQILLEGRCTEQLDDTTAIHVMVVVNELMTNALKHSAGPVTVRYETDAGRISIRVASDAPLANDFDLEETRGFGIMMIRTIADVLAGDIEVTARDPAEIRFRFPPAASSGLQDEGVRSARGLADD